MLDKKVIRKSFIIIAIILFILIGIIFIRRTFSRYESDAESTASTSLALWVINESFVSEDIYIGELEPMPANAEIGELELMLANAENENQYKKEVEFSIQNYKDNLVTSVPLRYSIKLITTTNLPLKYELYQYGEDHVLKTEPCTLTERIITDEDGTFYRELSALPSRTPDGNNFFFEKVLEGENNKQKDEFVLMVWLLNNENDFLTSSTENYFFADLIEHVKLEIKAEQITSED